MELCQPVILTDQNIASFVASGVRNPIKLSCIHALEDNFTPRGFGLRYIYSGLGRYLIDRRQHNLTDGTYLLLNTHTHDCEMAFRSGAGAPNWGVCIDLDADYFSGLLKALARPEELDDDAQAERFLLSDELFQTALRAGPALQAPLRRLLEGALRGEALLSADFFIRELSDALVRDQAGLIRDYYRLDAVKTSTRKEQFTRLLRGKEWLDAHTTGTLAVRDAAAAACLSEFRFHHLFKQAFRTSPYHYALRQKMDAALRLRRQGHTWNDTALLLGFGDVQAFGKAFKKIYGASPRALERRDGC